MGNIISFLAAIPVPELNFVGDIVAALYNLIGNYGWTVVVFTIILKVITLPLDFWQRGSAKKNAIKMQQMQPMMDKIDKAYGANKKGAQQEKQKLMKKFGYSMFSSCLPTLVTLVFFIVMFSGLTSYSTHANVQEYNDLVDSYHYNLVLEAKESGKITLEETLANVVVGEYEKGDWTAEAETAFQGKFKQDMALLATTDDTAYSNIIEATKPAVGKFGGENRESFLWIKNIWRADTWINVMPDYNEFTNGGIAMGGIKGADKVEYEVIYDAVSTYAGGYAEGSWNGLLILPALAIVLSFLSTKISMKTQQTANDPQSQATQKMMSLMMPLMMSIFILMYTAALGVYIVANTLLSILTSLALTPIINRVYKNKEVHIVKQASYRR